MVVPVVVARGARHKYVCIIRCDLPHYPTRSDSCFITMSTLPCLVLFLSSSPFKRMVRNHPDRKRKSADRYPFLTMRHNDRRTTYRN